MTIDVIVTSFSIGLLATTSPCVLPLYPGFLAYLSGGAEKTTSHSERISQSGRYFLGFFVLAGVLAMMLVLGGVIALLSVSVGRALSVFIPLADGLILILGLMLLADINVFKGLPQVQVPFLSNPYLNAFVYGLLYGPIALPCSGPFVVGIFALSLTPADVFEKLSVFLWFGLGFGLPLLILSFLSGAAQRWITRMFARRARLINFVGGILLVGVAIYDLTQNWALIQTFL